MTYSVTYQKRGRMTGRSRRTMSRLNRNRIGDKQSDKVVKTMGLAACQGLCITYNLHSKRFCK